MFVFMFSRDIEPAPSAAVMPVKEIEKLILIPSLLKSDDVI